MHNMTNLEGAWIKINRSAQHITELERNVQIYLSSKPFGLIKVEAPNGDLIYQIKILRPVPVEWSAIVGDAVHNMRSALDLLAWQLVEANSGVPSRSTCFPIGKTPPPAYDKVVNRALAGANSRAIHFIKRLRPYPGGNVLLDQLHSLDVTDKHRLVLIVGAAHKHVVMKVKMMIPGQQTSIEFLPLAIAPTDRQFPLRDGMEVFAIRAAARTSEDMTDFQLVFELAFGDVA